MMIVTAGVVLARRPYGEYGRMATLYTREMGRISARLAGVDRPKAKLKAFSEPMICAEYRLYLRPGSAWATVTGGKLVDTYPGLRSDLERMLGGLEMCELLLRLTPEHAPSARKFELITGFLAAYAEVPAPCLPVAFGLRLLELLGLGAPLRNNRAGTEEEHGVPAGAQIPVWDKLVNGPPEDLLSENFDPLELQRLREYVRHAAEAYLQRPLNAPQVRASMSARPEARA